MTRSPKAMPARGNNWNDAYKRASVLRLETVLFPENLKQHPAKRSASSV